MLLKLCLLSFFFFSLLFFFLFSGFSLKSIFKKDKQSPRVTGGCFAHEVMERSIIQLQLKLCTSTACVGFSSLLCSLNQQLQPSCRASWESFFLFLFLSTPMDFSPGPHSLWHTLGRRSRLAAGSSVWFVLHKCVEDEPTRHYCRTTLFTSVKSLLSSEFQLNFRHVGVFQHHLRQREYFAFLGLVCLVSGWVLRGERDCGILDTHWNFPEMELETFMRFLLVLLLKPKNKGKWQHIEMKRPQVCNTLKGRGPKFVLSLNWILIKGLGEIFSLLIPFKCAVWQMTLGSEGSGRGRKR